MKYGKSSNGNLAIARDCQKAVWDVVEVLGELYSFVDYEDLTDDEIDRILELEDELDFLMLTWD